MDDSSLKHRLRDMLARLTESLGRKPALDEIQKGLSTHLNRRIEEFFRVNLNAATAQDIVRMQAYLEELRNPAPPTEIVIPSKRSKKEK